MEAFILEAAARVLEQAPPREALEIARIDFRDAAESC